MCHGGDGAGERPSDHDCHMQPLSLQQLVTHSDGLCCPTCSDGSLGNKCSSELFLTLSEAPALSCDVIGLRHSSAQPSHWLKEPLDF